MKSCLFLVFFLGLAQIASAANSGNGNYIIIDQGGLSTLAPAGTYNIVDTSDPDTNGSNGPHSQGTPFINSIFDSINSSSGNQNDGQATFAIETPNGEEQVVLGPGNYGPPSVLNNRNCVVIISDDGVNFGSNPIGGNQGNGNGNQGSPNGNGNPTGNPPPGGDSPAVVPEPSTWALLFLSIAGLALFRRFRVSRR